MAKLTGAKTETGKFTRKIDAALHLSKAAELYQQLNSNEAAIFTQLRTGKTFLKEYLFKIKALETANCDCGFTESIAHFLFSCSRWTQQRIKMRQQHGEQFEDLSYALGGYSSRQEGGKNIDGPIEHWKLSRSANFGLGKRCGMGSIKTILNYRKERGSGARGFI
jgi:hypothetical protein